MSIVGVISEPCKIYYHQLRQNLPTLTWERQVSPAGPFQLMNVVTSSGISQK
jgi:hypothetical protein